MQTKLGEGLRARIGKLPVIPPSFILMIGFNTAKSAFLGSATCIRSPSRRSVGMLALGIFFRPWSAQIDISSAALERGSRRRSPPRLLVDSGSQMSIARSRWRSPSRRP